MVAETSHAYLDTFNSLGALHHLPDGEEVRSTLLQGTSHENTQKSARNHQESMDLENEPGHVWRRHQVSRVTRDGSQLPQKSQDFNKTVTDLPYQWLD